jgi:hypothetical protein
MNEAAANLLFTDENSALIVFARATTEHGTAANASSGIPGRIGSFLLPESQAGFLHLRNARHSPSYRPMNPTQRNTWKQEIATSSEERRFRRHGNVRALSK